MKVTDQDLQNLALTRAEYEAIIERLERTPNPLELEMFAALWSEHCGYKHTRNLIKTLPSRSERTLVQSGAENAGAVKINDSASVVLKIESHNHPSALEPHQGAATGVGGIVRDILAMGARPIALLNSLRFGKPMDDVEQRRLLGGVVEGISNYGNSIGVPDVGGEVQFHPSYKGNPLVNAMCVGLLDDDRMMAARADAPGNLLVIAGAETGRDGIHGASTLASKVFEDDPAEKSSVQIGDPFFGKCLIEACLEIAQLEDTTGLQDCGAAGITSAAIEMAARSGLGVKIDVAEVPSRQQNMTAYEVMLSESQERMLLAVKPGAEELIGSILEKWGLSWAVIGQFTNDGTATVQEAHKHLASIPVQLLTDPPEYKFNPPAPQSLLELQSADLAQIPLPKLSPDNTLLQMLASPNITSKRSIFQQYDHMVQNNTVVPPGADAAVLRLKRHREGLAVTVDGNGRFCYLNPYVGGAIAVAEACRNLSAVGATPIALTDGLNFGNPETESVQYQIYQAVRGIKDAAEALNVPVVSGNASLYNESSGRAIMPTPIIGALGLLEDVNDHVKTAFKAEEDELVVLGTSEAWDSIESLAGSEYAFSIHGRLEGNPSVDLDMEARCQNLCREAIAKGILHSAHDCSEGGLLVAVAESAIAGNIGAVLDLPMPDRWDAAMFGESQSRLVVSLPKRNLKTLIQMAERLKVPYVRIGSTGGDSITAGHNLNLPLRVIAEVWENSFEKATGQDFSVTSQLPLLP